MNATRRKALNEMHSAIEELNAKRAEVVDGIQALLDEESEYLSNMPESLQSGDKAEKAQEAIDYMEAAINALDESACDEALEAINSAMG